jgi:ABC-type lipoprotein release transport system permease subunit
LVGVSNDRRTGASVAVALWARREVRARWRSLVVLGVLAGLAAGVALAAVAGARRTSSAYARYRRATNAPDAILFGTQVGRFDVDYSPVIRLPEVVDGGRFTLSPLMLDGKFGALPPGDDHLYRTISRPLLVAGRQPRPGRADEVVVNRVAAKKFHYRVGDRVTIRSSTDINAFFGQAPFDGPRQRATVVGIGDSLMDLLFSPDEPSFVAPYAFLRAHPEVPRAPNLVVRLAPGTDVERFRARAESLLRLPDIPVRNLAEDSKRFTHATDLERTGLLLFAAAVVLAALVLVGQALTRTVYGIADSSSALRALGLTRRDLVSGLSRPLVLSAVTSALVATVTAIGLSGRLPIGMAGRLDPDKGIHADWVVLAAGALLVAIAVLVGAVLTALWATSRRAQRADDRLPSLLRPLERVAPLPVRIGAGLAFDSGTGERSLPVRPAIAGAVAGVLGIVGAFGLVHGIDDAIAQPGRSGQLWEATMFVDDTHSLAQLRAAAVRDPAIDEISILHRAPVDVQGAGLPVYSAETVRGRSSYLLLHGREPARPTDVVIGPTTGKELHRGIGDTLRVGRPARTLHIVGTALLPQTPHSSFDQGLWTTNSTLRALVPTDPNQTGLTSADEVVVGLTFNKGVKAPAAIARLHRVTGAEVDTTALPQDVLFLRNVRTLPKALAGFLALLGIAALGHALVTAVRRRRHDLAVLRALGFRPAQVAGCIASQATLVAAIALLLGIPLGIVAGRLSWRWVASSTPLLYVAPVAAVTVVVIVPAALMLANLLAALPARRAARLRPSDVLRTE